MSRFERAFFRTTAPRLARALLGTLLVRVLDDGERLSGRIVETEAYCGTQDQGSHARNGRRTPRNEAMYGQAGTAYVYFTYGMHHCVNVVCGDVGVPSAVLVRALEPIEGIDRMRTLRGPAAGGTARPVTDLCSGPGKLCRAMAIDRMLDHADLVTGRALFLEAPASWPGRLEVQRTARIGLRSAGEWTHKPLRWVMRGNPHASRSGQARA